MVLASGETECVIDRETGAVLELSSRGKLAIDGGMDRYTLELPGSAMTDLRSDESADRAGQVREYGTIDGVAHVWVRCRNEPLKIWVNKTYWVEPGTHMLFKRIEVEADRAVSGFFIHESGIDIPHQWWRGGVIWKPTWHEHINAHRTTASIEEEIDLRANNTVRPALMLFQPHRQETLVHWRWGGERFEWFDSFIEKPPYGYRVAPGRWYLANAYGFVGGELNKRITTQMVYGVIHGTPIDFCLQYAKRPGFQRLWVEPKRRAPAWLYDTMIDDAFDYTTIAAGHKTTIARFLGNKHPGYMQAVWWHPFPYEYYIARASDMEPRSMEDPVASAATIAEMEGVHPRYKVGPYTHFGHPAAHPDSKLAAIATAKGWVPMRRDGTRVHMGADYNLTPFGSVPINRTVREYRQSQLDRWAELFDYFGSSLFYTDSAPVPARTENDWGSMTSGSAGLVQQYYRDLESVALGRGKALFTNYPVGLGTSGFSEFSWYTPYKDDWRFTSGRLATQQALNFVPRRLYMCGYQHPSGSMTDDSIRIHVNYMTLLGIGFSLLDVKPPQDKEQFLREAAPYLMAAWEIRNRNMVDANVEPEWFDAKGETEVYAWRALDGYGLVTAMSHDAGDTEETLSFDLEPLGIEPGSPVYVWRAELGDARELDFGEVTWESPVRRLVDQRLLETSARAPERMDVDVVLRHENPIALLVTDSPALVTQIGDRTCQYWLPPAAYGLDVKVNIAGDKRLDMMIDSPGPEAELILPLPAGVPGDATAMQRRWSKLHAAGVAPGFEAVDHTFVSLDGGRFIEVTVGEGSTEVVVE